MRGLRRRSLGGAAMAVAGGELLYRGLSGHCHLYQVLGRRTVESGARREAGAPDDAPEVDRSITIGQLAEDLYLAWREPQYLRQIMGHFAEVTAASEDRAHWVVRGPRGRTLEWDAHVVEDRPGEFLRWESLPGAQLPNEGSVRFRQAPRDRGTEVTLRVRFDPPAGALGDAAAKLLGVVPKTIADKALRHFKSLVETGEIPTTEHQPAARNGGRGE